MHPGGVFAYLATFACLVSIIRFLRFRPTAGYPAMESIFARSRMVTPPRESETMPSS